MPPISGYLLKIVDNYMKTTTIRQGPHRMPMLFDTEKELIKYAKKILSPQKFNTVDARFTVIAVPVFIKEK